MDRTPTRTATVLAIVVAVLLAPLAGGAAATTSSSSSGAPPGMVGVPDGNIQADLPADADVGLTVSDLRGETMASAHADSLEVILTTPSRAGEYLEQDGSNVVGNGDVALVLQDDLEHDGRDVALPASKLREAFGGYLPKRVYGTHDSGTEWSRETHVEDGSLVFTVPRFSTNTVTFQGSIEITDSPATDGTTHEYQLDDLDAASAPNVTFTGSTSSEWDNESGQVGLPSSTSLSVAGNVDPVGPDGGLPVLEVTGSEGGNWSTPYDSSSSEFAFAGTDGDGNLIKSEMEVQDVTGTFDRINPNVTQWSGSGSGIRVDVYVVEEGADGTYSEGELVKSEWDPSTGTPIAIDPYSPSSSTETVTVEFVTVSGSGSWNYALTNVDESASSTWTTSTTTTTGEEELNSEQAYSDVELSLAGGATNLSATIGGETETFGDVARGETASATLDVPLSASTLDFDGTGVVNYTLRLKERTQTVDPGVDLNGETASYSGVLAGGETATVNLSGSALVSGTNQLTVSVGDGSLSADAPTASVGLNYSHGAASDVSTSYSASKWTETYNVSKTWVSDRQDASLTVPFAGDVLEVADVTAYVNGDETAVSTSYEDTTLEVDLGDVASGDKTRVVATGHKINVHNGSVTVTEPTTTGNVLDSRIRFDEWSDDSALGVGGNTGDRTLYTTSESWGDPQPYAAVDADGNERVYLPGASAGSETRVRTMPLDVTPDSGSVEFVVLDPAEPRFRIRPAGSDTDVTLEWRDVVAGETFALEAVSEQDREVSSSSVEDGMVSLRTDSDNVVYRIVEKEESSGAAVGASGDDSGGSGGSWSPLTIVALFGGLTVSIGGFVYLGRRFGARGARQNVVLLVGGTVVGLVGVEAVTAQSVVSSVTYAFGDAAGGFASSGFGALALGTGGMLALYYVRQRFGWVPETALILAAAGTVVWVVEQILPGSLSGGLGVVSPLLLLVGGLGLAWIIYAKVRGRPVVIRPGNLR